MDWNHILNWKLLWGSHDFPGPDGGTCINEAAVVAAGFKYRTVVKADDCPSCFSRPIATYAIIINDAMPYDLRQKLLLPFVTRLAGTADDGRIEQERARLMVMRTINEIMPIALMIVGLRADAQACSKAVCPDTAVSAAAHAADAASVTVAAARGIAPGAHVDMAVEACTAYAVQATNAAAAAYAADRAAHAAASAIEAAFQAGLDDARICHIAADILDNALRIGRQADPPDVTVIKGRLDAARTGLEVRKQGKDQAQSFSNSCA